MCGVSFTPLLFLATNVILSLWMLIFVFHGSISSKIAPISFSLFENFYEKLPLGILWLQNFSNWQCLFVQGPLKDHFISLGILHQTSCFHTSQQNRIAEHKHYHLFYVTCTLLVEMRVSTTYPFSSFGREVSLHHLHPHTHLFSLPPHIFGCVTFIQDYSLNLSKLSPKTLKGIFIYYSQTLKDYCIHLLDFQK